MLTLCCGVFLVFFQPAWSNSHYFLLDLVPCCQQVFFVHLTPASRFFSVDSLFPVSTPAGQMETAWGLWAIVYQPAIYVFFSLLTIFFFKHEQNSFGAWENLLNEEIIFVFTQWFPLLPYTGLGYSVLCQKCICIFILCTTARRYKQSLRGAEKDHIKVLTWLAADCIW